ncbi:hypothetical protein B0H13DRAFT_1597276, partial [Mycena leptocephala]
NGLVKLAILLLSIVPNSAGSEREFSKFGIFLTQLRSQLSIQKVRKMNIVDMELKRKHDELGLTTDGIKQKFTSFAEQCAREGGGMSGYEEADSFAGLSTSVVKVRFGSGSEGFSPNPEPEPRVRFDQSPNLEPGPAFGFGSGSNAFKPNENLSPSEVKFSVGKTYLLVLNHPNRILTLMSSSQALVIPP